MTIRPETSEDQTAVRRINELAFGQPDEAALVDALRLAAHPHISLVAVDEDEKVVGHIFFSPVTVESNDAAAPVMGLAPMAVLPEHQRQGIGSLLIQAGLKECQRLSSQVVVVLGHPEYYPRFGFIPASSKGLRCEYPVQDEAFMIAELEPGALAGLRGLVKYHPEFAKL